MARLRGGAHPPNAILKIPGQQGFIVRWSHDPNGTGLVYSAVSGYATIPLRTRRHDTSSYQLDYDEVYLPPAPVGPWMDEGTFVRYDCVRDAYTGDYAAHNIEFIGKPLDVERYWGYGFTSPLLSVDAVVTTVAYGANAHLVLWNDRVGRIFAPHTVFTKANTFDIASCTVYHTTDDPSFREGYDIPWVAVKLQITDSSTSSEKLRKNGGLLITSDGWKISSVPSGGVLGRLRKGYEHACFDTGDLVTEGLSPPRVSRDLSHRVTYVKLLAAGNEHNRVLLATPLGLTGTPSTHPNNQYCLQQ